MKEERGNAVLLHGQSIRLDLTRQCRRMHDRGNGMGLSVIKLDGSMHVKAEKARCSDEHTLST